MSTPARASSPRSRRRSRTSAAGPDGRRRRRRGPRERGRPRHGGRSSSRPTRSTSWPRQARGWICLALTPERCDELGLELMTAKNESPHQTPFTVTIEAREGVTTGISAADQAHTMQVAVDPAKGRDDIVTAGPRPPAQGQAPAACSSAPATPRRSVDLARLAGLHPGRRDLRDHERGRLDGARPRPRRRTASSTA